MQLLKFQTIVYPAPIPDKGKNTVYLRTDDWDDYGFKTLFHLSLHDSEGKYVQVGGIKIGFFGQKSGVSTGKKLKSNFEKLDESFFSLGENFEFYRKINQLGSLGLKILESLHDLVQNNEILLKLQDEEVFRDSFLRSASLSVIKGQFLRGLNGQPMLEDFHFQFSRDETESVGKIQELKFNVKANSVPSTNIHALIGRNGVGKTTLINDMVDAIFSENTSKVFYDLKGSDTRISKDYFSTLISVSFSIFDPFSPRIQQADPAKGTCFFYIGLKQHKDGKDKGKTTLNTLEHLYEEFQDALELCLKDESRAKKWCKAIELLNADPIFQEINLRERIYTQWSNNDSQDKAIYKKVINDATDLISRKMSSGHAVVFLTITHLVAKVQEKTLILLDEPESHLHPPLLSAFIRALSDLLFDQNGIAIIATHSPVVLQEVPRSCVWKIYRSHKEVRMERPEIQTFGENVGILTKEVFGLEVEKTGFYSLLATQVDAGKNYDAIISDFI